MSEEFSLRLTAAARLWLPWPLILLAMALLAPSAPAQQRLADPLLALIGTDIAVPATIFISLALALFWSCRRRVPGPTIRRETLWALAALALVAVTLGGLRVLYGPALPGFVPPEESAGPGITLGLSAGMLEEAVFRLACLPVLLILAGRRLAPAPAALIAVLLTGLLFALSHEWHEPQWHWPHFITRLLLPGILMSVIFLRVSPAAVLTGHCAAHILIPWLFLPPLALN